MAVAAGNKLILHRSGDRAPWVGTHAWGHEPRATGFSLTPEVPT
ncbi:MAG: hypothetical protein AVDCRST_MAG76-2630 [uncultured Acidimicrobiales bacterium]|uniref:Uncharacterized protein n=1 Tax=uncultured Acidimicrobiales bacterium TaxID=310071 RepID=A0A6J4INB1_9ACTN|nr:MAG: hypothetical protein AVDCRST_MAG76-2630 [uncultured Acidimicrobiales bacterium]